MNDKQKIILQHINGGSLRQISETTGLHRKTVTRCIKQYDRQRHNSLKCGKPEVGEIIDEIVKAPVYNSSSRKKRKLTDEIIEKIKLFLESNRQKRVLGQRKQQMKKIDIYEALIKAGFDIGYTTVCNLIKEIENSGNEAFVKQKYEPGEVCEFDWGEVKIFTNDKLEKYQMSVFTSAVGNFRYSRLFKKQDTQSFQQSHAYFHEKIGGSYKTMVYDNMRVAVKKFVGRTEKEPTEGLLKLSLYYNFDFRFCNVRKGNEKGHVEKSVEYIRRKAFSEIDHFETEEAANIYLEKICDQLNAKPQIGNDNKTALEILEFERPYLLPRLPFFECAIIEQSRVDKYSTVSIETCHYSLPEQFVGKMVTAKIYPAKIIFSYDDKNICEHTRIVGFHKWVINIDHYTTTLKRKPGALHGSLALDQMDEKLKNIYQEHYSTKPKDFIELIEYLKNSSLSIQQVEFAITTLLKTAQQEITTDKIKIICEKKDTEKAPINDRELENECIFQLTRIQNLLTADVVEVAI